MVKKPAVRRSTSARRPGGRRGAAHARGNAKSIEVDVLDKSGTQVKSDTLSF